ncbi:gap junction delta-3 protein [Sarotherodon galilaeus]
MGPLAEAASSLQRGRVQSEKPTAGLLSGSHFHVAGKGDQSVCRRRRVADGELRQRRRQGEQADFGFRVRLRIRGQADPAIRILP